MQPAITWQPEAEQATEERLGTAPEHDYETSLYAHSEESTRQRRERPSWEDSRVFRIWNHVFHEKIDALHAAGKRAQPRGQPIVRLAHVYARFYVVDAERLVHEMRQGQFRLGSEDVAEVCVQIGRFDRQTFGLIDLRDRAGDFLGSFLQERLGFLGDPFAPRNVGALSRLLRQHCREREGVVIYAQGTVALPGKKWHGTKAVSLFLPSLQRYGPAYEVLRGSLFVQYKGKDPTGLLTQILRMNLAEVTRIPTLEVEGLVVRDRWQALLRAYEVAVGGTFPLSWIKRENQSPGHTEIRTPA